HTGIRGGHTSGLLAHLRIGLSQHAFRRLPAHTRIRHRHAIAQLPPVRWDGLVALLQVALHHETDQVPVAANALLYQVLPHLFLERVLFGGIAMTAIDHQDWLHAHLS